MRIKIYSLGIVICLILSSFVVLSSCNTLLDEPVGIDNAEINENGELVIFYSNGETKNVGVVVGEKGADGKDGVDGSDGVDGKDGVDGSDGVDGKDGVDGADGNSSQIIVNGGENSIPLATAKGLRSAVSIVCKFQATVQQGGWYPGMGGSTVREYASSGSGVIYKLDKSSGDAFIITNYHVVYYASSNTSNGISNDISIYLYGSETEEKAIKATYVGGSLYYDIAVLRVEDSEILKKSDACQIDVADSNKVMVGANAIAIGNAQGEGISASLGIVSVDSEHITVAAADDKTQVTFRVMRIDTAVNSGNSGGGIFDDKGNLIGIVNIKIIKDGVENIGYAIPSNIATSVADNIIYYCFGTTTENVQRALVGVTVDSSDSCAAFDSNTGTVFIKENVFVSEIDEGSLADGVLQKGDVLLSVTLKGKTIEIYREHYVIDMMLNARVGDVVTFNILRSGEAKTVSITITQDCVIAY